MITDEKVTREQAMAPCTCGTNAPPKMYGACCGMMKKCFCGSGKPVGQCCMADPNAHGVDMDKKDEM